MDSFQTPRSVVELVSVADVNVMFGADGGVGQ